MELVLGAHDEVASGSETTPENLKSWAQDNQKLVKAIVRLIATPPNQNEEYRSWIATAEGVKPVTFRPHLDAAGEIEGLGIVYFISDGTQEIVLRKTPRTFEDTNWVLPSLWMATE